MKRPRQHEIDTAARRQFEQSLPEAWILRPQPDDYGIDCEVEIFNQHESTGVIFKVQLKGTIAPVLSADGKILRIRLRVPNALYLCHQIDVPVVVVVADLSTARTAWYTPQVDKYLKSRLQSAIESSQKTITLHIPMSNLLPDTTDLLLRAISQSQTVLATRSVIETRVPEFVYRVVGPLDSQEVIRAFQERSDALRIETIDTLLKAGDLDKAKTAIHNIMATPESTVEAKFAALGYGEKIAAAEAPSGAGKYEFLAARLDIARAMRSLAQKGPARLKYYAAVALKAAELECAVREDFALFLNWRVHQEHGDPFWLAILSFRRRGAAELVVRRYRHVTRLLNCIVEAEHFSAFPQAAARVIQAMISFHLRLREEGLDKAADAYGTSLVQIADFAFDLATKLHQWEDAALICVSALWLADLQDTAGVRQRVAWTRERILQIKPDAIRDQALLQLEEAEREMLEVRPREPTEDDFEWEYQAYTEMARALGIDLRDASDPIAQIIRQGLEDLNPERVLKNCQHLFVTIESYGLPGEWLKLPTAGSKLLYCTLHGHGIGGMVLDTVYSILQSRYCKKCPNVTPHPDRWRWTRKWQLEQDKKYPHLARHRFYV